MHSNIVLGWSPSQTPTKHRGLFARRSPLAQMSVTNCAAGGRNPCAIYHFMYCEFHFKVHQSPRCFGCSVSWERKLDPVHWRPMSSRFFRPLMPQFSSSNLQPQTPSEPTQQKELGPAPVVGSTWINICPPNAWPWFLCIVHWPSLIIIDHRSCGWKSQFVHKMLLVYPHWVHFPKDSLDVEWRIMSHIRRSVSPNSGRTTLVWQWYRDDSSDRMPHPQLMLGS